MSVGNFGDYELTETVVIPFNTFSSDNPSASITITDLAVADVEIHKDGNVGLRSSDNGIAVVIDFAGITGNHVVTVDLSDDTHVGYYSKGSRYQVRIEGTDIFGAVCNVWIGTFSIGCILRLATIIEGTITLQDVLKVALAALAGESDGAGTILQHFRDQADSLNRITANVDEFGNRTSITLDLG